jgi:hypothetical protein
MSLLILFDPTETIGDGAFNSGAGWTLSNATISGGKLNVTSALNEFVAQRTDLQLLPSVAYRSVIVVSNYTSGGFIFDLQGGGDAVFGAAVSANGTYTDIFVSPAGAPGTIPNANILALGAGFTGSIDSWSIKPALALTGQTATYTMTGQSAVLSAVRRLEATSAAAFVMSGQSAVLRASRRLTANLATFALTGQSAILKAGRVLTANLATYSIGGQSASLNLFRRLSFNAGSFILTGQSASLKKQSVLSLNAGSYTLSGQSAGLAALRKLIAQSGSFTLTGQDAIIAKSAASYVLNLNTGSFAIVGQSASLKAQRLLSGNTGSYSMVGQSAGLSKTSFLSLLTGSYVITGKPAILAYSGVGGGTAGVRVTAAFFRA